MDAVPERFDHTVPVPGLTDPAAKNMRKLRKQKGPQDVNPAAPNPRFDSDRLRMQDLIRLHILGIGLGNKTDIHRGV